METLNTLNIDEKSLLISILEVELNNFIEIKDRTKREHWNVKILELEKIIQKIRN